MGEGLDKPNYLAGAYVQRDGHLRKGWDSGELLQCENIQFLPFLDLKACLNKENMPLLIGPDETLLKGGRTLYFSW